jgi:hypothetical protein
MLGGPLLDRPEPGGLQPAGAHAALLLRAHEAGLLEQLQVLADGGDGDPQRLGQPRDRLRSQRQTTQDRPPRRVAQRLEDAIDLHRHPGSASP